jgi:hypothetical protein
LPNDAFNFFFFDFFVTIFRTSNHLKRTVRIILNDCLLSYEKILK